MSELGMLCRICLYPPPAQLVEPRGCGFSAIQMPCSTAGCQGCWHSPSPCFSAPSAVAARFGRSRARQHRRAAVVGAGRQDSVRVGVQEGQDLLLLGLLGPDAFDDLDLEFSTSSTVQDRLARSLGASAAGRPLAGATSQNQHQLVNDSNHQDTSPSSSSSNSSNRRGRQQEPQFLRNRSAWQHPSGQQSGQRYRTRNRTASLDAGSNNVASSSNSSGAKRRFNSTGGKGDWPQKLDDPLITAMIMRCRSLHSLDEVCHLHSQHFNHLHIACAFNRLAKTPDALVEAHASVTHNLLTLLEQQFVEHLPWYTAREVANVIWSWGKLGHFPSAAVWQAVSAAITRDRGSLLYSNAATPQALANLAWGLCQIRCKDQGVWDALEAAVQSALVSARSPSQPGGATGAAFAPLDIAGIAWSMASAGRYNLLVFHELCAAAMVQLHEFCPQDVSNMLWACATVQHPYRPLFEAAAPVILTTLPGFSPQAIANTMWAYVTAGVYHEALFQAMGKEATACAHRLEPAHLCQLAWAMGKAHVCHPQFIQAAVLKAQAQSRSFKTRELALLLWAVAALKLADKEALDSLASHILGRMLAANGMLPQKALAASHKPRVVSSNGNAVQSHSTSSGSSDAAPASPARHESGAAFNAQDVANTVWAYAASGLYCPKVFNMAAQLCVANSAAFLAAPQSVQGVMWCFGYVGHYDPQLCELVASHLAQPAAQHRMTPYQVAGTLLPLAQLQHTGSSKDACRAIAANFMQALQSRDSSSVVADAGQRGSGESGNGSSRGGHGIPRHDSLAKVLWSFALLRHFDAKFFSATFRRIGAQWLQRLQQEERARQKQGWLAGDTPTGSRWQDASTQNLSGSSGSSSHELEHQQLGSRAGAVWLQPRGQQVQQQHQQGGNHPQVGTLQRSGGILPKQLAQYFHVYLWLQDSGSPSALKAASCLPLELVAEARAVWQQQVEKQRIVSDFQGELYQVLCSMGLQPRMECLTADRLFSVDMVIQLGGQQVAVEANGPVHYTSTEPRRLLGNKVLRDWFLQKRGYKVLNVPWWLWADVGGDRHRGRAFVRQQLVNLLGPEVLQQLDSKESAGRG